jgi:hypothetical protein
MSGARAARRRRELRTLSTDCGLDELVERFGAPRVVLAPDARIPRAPSSDVAVADTGAGSGVEASVGGSARSGGSGSGGGGGGGGPCTEAVRKQPAGAPGRGLDAFEGALPPPRNTPLKSLATRDTVQLVEVCLLSERPLRDGA